MEVKDLAENKISKLKNAAETMAEKIATYQKVDPSLHVLVQMNIADIIKCLPKISRNTFEVFQLFVNAYGEN